MRQLLVDLTERKVNETNYYADNIRQGENLGCAVAFKLSDEYVMDGYTYLMALQNNEGNVMVTSGLTLGADNIVSYALPNSIIAQAGVLKVELRVQKTSGSTTILAKSFVVKFKVIESLDGSTTIVPTDFVPWYTQATNAAATATTKAQEAANSATAAATSATQAETYKNQAATIAEETAEDTIETTMSAHIENTMPHQVKDTSNNKTYKIGLQIVNGVTQFIYEEVTE